MHAKRTNSGSATYELAAASLEAAAAILAPSARLRFATVLGGEPLACADVRALAAEAHGAEELLAVDNSLAGVAACDCIRLGADIVLEGERNGKLLVRASEVLAQGAPELAKAPAAASSEQDLAAWRRASDTAAAFAAYLRCHPKLAEVRYPGLKDDPSFQVAARTLESGFGPLVCYKPKGGAQYATVDCRGRELAELIQSFEDMAW